MNREELKLAIDELDDDQLGTILDTLLDMIEESNTHMYNYKFESESGQVYASSEDEAVKRVKVILFNEHDITIQDEDTLHVW